MIKRKAMDSKNFPMDPFIKDNTLRANLKEKGFLGGVTDRITRANGERENGTALAAGKETMGSYMKVSGGTASQMGQGLLQATATPMKDNLDSPSKMVLE